MSNLRLAILGGALVLVACGSGANTGGGPAAGGEPTPAGSGASGNETTDITDFTLTDVDGNSVSLSQYVGKSTIVISFWATWCKPCVAEMPHLQKLFEAKKAMVLAISLDGPETEAEVAPFVKKKGFTFPVLIDSETRAASLYNPRRAAPYTVIVDKHGKIVKRREGFNPGDEAQLEADVASASQ